jgi:hypothetical protein
MVLGLSKLKMGVINDKKYSYDYVVDFVPLTQKEIANGWCQKIPMNNKKSIQHHFSITLDELPFNLWNKINKYSNDEFYIVKNNIFLYSITKTEYDELIFNLYNEINKSKPNLNIIKELYENLKSKFNGWLIIKANLLLQKN